MHPFFIFFSFTSLLICRSIAALNKWLFVKHNNYWHWILGRQHYTAEQIMYVTKSCHTKTKFLSKIAKMNHGYKVGLLQPSQVESLPVGQPARTWGLEEPTRFLVCILATADLVNFQSQNDFLSVCESAPFTDWPCPINSFYAFCPNSWFVLHPQISQLAKLKDAARYTLQNIHLGKIHFANWSVKAGHSHTCKKREIFGFSAKF